MSNRGVVYLGPGKVAVKSIPYPELYLAEQQRRCEHGVILKVVVSAICGSDVHMYRGRTTAQPGIVFGHEITGEVIARGTGVEFVNIGDLVSVPFNIACGRCQNCEEGKTGICLNVNPARPGAAYGYVDMGGWIGGQAEYVMVPYADFNCLVVCSGQNPIARAHAMDRILSIACLADIFPTGYHGAVSAGVKPGSRVYVAGAGPVGLACACSCQLLGASVVIVGDMNAGRLAQAKSFGCLTVDLSKNASLSEQLKSLIGTTEVDCAIDCVGFEARGCGSDHTQEQPAIVLNQMMAVTRAGGAVGIPGLYVTDDPGARDDASKQGSLSIRIGLGWAKSLSFVTGQCPVKRYNRALLSAILADKVDIASAVNVQVVSLDDAVRAYGDFDNGASKKYLIDPHGIVRQHFASKSRL